MVIVLPTFFASAQGVEATPASDYFTYVNADFLSAHPAQDGKVFRATDEYLAQIDSLLDTLYAPIDATDPIDHDSPRWRVSTLQEQFLAVRQGKDEHAFVLSLLEQIDACTSIEELAACADGLNLAYGLPGLVTFTGYEDQQKQMHVMATGVLTGSYVYLNGGNVEPETLTYWQDKLTALLACAGLKDDHARTVAELDLDTAMTLCSDREGKYSQGVQ